MTQNESPRQTASQTPAPSQPDPQATIASLNAVIKALVVKYGTPEATTPLSFIALLTQREVTDAYRLALSIRPQPADVNPEPWLLLTVEGV